MYIALMADIKDDAVVRQVKDPVHGDRNLDSAEIGGEVPTALCYLVDKKAAQIGAEPFGIRVGQRFQFFVGMNPVKVRILVFFHGNFPLSNCTVLRPQILRIGQSVEISIFAHIFAREFSTIKMCKMCITACP